MRGRFLPGIPLNVHAIAAENDMSVSPVRDGLQRLTGERLLIARSGGGFECPRLNVEGAHDLYSWHDKLVRWAIVRRHGTMPRINLLAEIGALDPEDTIGLSSMTAELFYRIGETCGSVEHMLAIRSAGERLHIMRLHETMLNNRKAELKRLAIMAKNAETKVLRDTISTYHRRRIRYLTQIMKATNRLP
jgi:hypothetical protein